MIEIIEITDDLREKYNTKLLEFESNFTYPFGMDMFYINHGNNYFKFFNLLGKPYIFLAVTGTDQLVGVIVIILRNIDVLNTGRTEPIWYICDLKIHPEYRGKAIIQEVFKLATRNYVNISQKIYGISMNAKNLKKNRLINLATRIPTLKLKHQDNLLFYMINKEQLNQMSFILKHHYNGLGYFSLSGVKDLVMNSTANPMPLIHIVPEEQSNIALNVIDEQPFLFCMPLSNPLIQEIEQLKIQPVATASIISNITHCDWNFVCSKEI